MPKPKRFFWWQVVGLLGLLGGLMALNRFGGAGRELKPTDEQLRPLPAMGRPIMTDAERLEREIRLIELRNQQAERAHQWQMQQRDYSGPFTTPGDGRMPPPQPPPAQLSYPNP